MMCDSDRNIIFDLAHESCEAHCDECGQCCGPYAIQIGLERFMNRPWRDVGDETFCEDCW